jgi:hypothetical protein
MKTSNQVYWVHRILCDHPVYAQSFLAEFHDLVMRIKVPKHPSLGLARLEHVREYQKNHTEHGVSNG